MTENSEHDDQVAKALREALAALPVSEPPSLDVYGAQRLVAVADDRPRRWAVWTAAAAVTTLAIGGIVAVSGDSGPGSVAGDSVAGDTGPVTSRLNEADTTGTATESPLSDERYRPLFLSQRLFAQPSGESLTNVSPVTTESNEIEVRDAASGDTVGTTSARFTTAERPMEPERGVVGGERRFVDLPELVDGTYRLVLDDVAAAEFRVCLECLMDRAPPPVERQDSVQLAPSLITASTVLVQIQHSPGLAPLEFEPGTVDRWDGAGGWVIAVGQDDLPHPRTNAAAFTRVLKSLDDGAYRLTSASSDEVPSAPVTHFFVESAFGRPVDPESKLTTTTVPSESPTTSPPAAAECAVSEAELREKIKEAAQGGFAFAGTVTNAEMRVHPESQRVESTSPTPVSDEPMPWVTFDVERWYTTDWGTSFSVFMPGLDPQVGDTWRVGGNAYYAMMDDFEGQSGEVDPCLAGLDADEGTRAIWDDAFGGSVPAGVNEPEGEPDPAVVDELRAAQRLWRETAPESYSVVITYWTSETRDNPTRACSPGSTGSYRVVVIDGARTEAVDLQNLCRRDPATLPSVDELFDESIRLAGAAEFSPHIDVEGGNPLSFYASDRSVEAQGNAHGVSANTSPAELGWDQVEAASDAARHQWETNAPQSYRLTINTGGGERNAHDVVARIDGDEVIELRVNGNVTDPATLELPWQPYTVGHIFDLTADRGLFEFDGSGDGPEGGSVVAVFDPETGLPTDIWFNPVINGVDDELEVHVRVEER